MKATITIDNALIVDLIHKHLVQKLGDLAAPSKDKILVRVRSKQNYREKQFEIGELQVTYEGEI